jgi:hypothetical protein
MSANAHDCLQWLPRLPDQTRKGQIQGNTEESGRGTNGVERRERPPTKGPLLGAKRQPWSSWPGKSRQAISLRLSMQ